MITNPPQDPKAKINWSEILGENTLRKQLITLIYKFAKLITETSSKI